MTDQVPSIVGVRAAALLDDLVTHITQRVVQATQLHLDARLEKIEETLKNLAPSNESIAGLIDTHFEDAKDDIVDALSEKLANKDSFIEALVEALRYDPPFRSAIKDAFEDMDFSIEVRVR